MIKLATILLALTADRTPVDLVPHLELFADPDHRYQIEDMVHAPFSPLGEGGVFGFSKSAWWLRFEITNPTADAMTPLIELSHVIGRAELYSPRPDGSFERRLAGKELPFFQREVRTRNVVFRLPLAAGETRRYHLKIQSAADTLQLTPARLWSADAFEDQLAGERLLFGLYYGVLVGLIIYNLFVFVSVRDRAYLYYVLFQAALTLELASLDQLTFQYFWPRSPAWALRSETVFAALAVFAGCGFARQFLRTETTDRATRRLLRAFMAAGLAVAALAIFTAPTWLQKIAAVLVGLSPLLLIWTGARAWRAGSSNARFFVIAWALLLASGLVSALTAMGVPLNLVLADYAPHLGSALEATVLALGLANRINQLRREQARGAEALARSRLERLKALDQLVSGVAHEIGNPLNFTQGGASDLERRLTDLESQVGKPLPAFASMRRGVKLIQGGNARIKKILENLRSYSASRPVQPEPTDIVGELESALALFAERLERQRIETVRELADRPTVSCRPGELHQVFMNLILNACQAMPEGGRLTVGCRVEAKQVILRVADTGPGVAPEHRESIFNPFFTTRAPDEGTGMGLSISHELVRRHGGELRLGDGGEGATFVVTLPI